MRILSAFVLLAVLGGLAAFLTFSSSWGALIAPQSKVTPAVVAADAASPTPDWSGKLTAAVSQSIVLRAAPVPSAPMVGMLRRGDTVALLGCDAEVLWCQTEDESWLLGYMVDALPGDLPIFDNPGVTVKSAKLALTPTAEPFTPPPSTPEPTAQPLAVLLPTPTPTPSYIETTVNEQSNLRNGPGITYVLVGSVAAGSRVQLVGQSDGGEWYKLVDGTWIAAFLVEPPVSAPPVVTPETASSASLVEAAISEAGANVPAAPEAAPETAPPENAVNTEGAPPASEPPSS
jgi:uncharacterized protein YraI